MEGGQIVPEWRRNMPVREVCTGMCDLTADTGDLRPSGTWAGSTFPSDGPGLRGQSQSYTMGGTQTARRLLLEGRKCLVVIAILGARDRALL